jgi:heat shock protein HtpX
MWEQISYNHTRSAILITVMGVFLLLLSLAISIPLGFMFHEDLSISITLGVILASIIWLAASLFAYFQGDDMLLALAGARKLRYSDHPRLFNIVEEMKIASGLGRMPFLYIVDDPAMNAFSVGCHPKKSTVIVTSGLLTKLDRDELQGVIGHEIAHIKNRDVLLMSLCILLLDSITLLAWIVMPDLLEQRDSLVRRYYWLLPFLSFLFATLLAALMVSSENFGGSGFIIVLILYVLAFVLSLPVFAQLIYYATSRRREYLADASSALYTRCPEGLASALEKIAASTEQVLSATPVTAPLYIVNPFRKGGKAASDITSTHPSISERIRILRSMAHISYTEYDRAYREVRNVDVGIIPAAAIASAVVVSMRAAMPDEMDHIQRTRETKDMLRNLNNYKIINCPCGTRLRVPPSFKLPEVRCPHCGRVNTV